MERLVRWYFLASLCYLAVALVAGLLIALPFVNHRPWSPMELLSPGRWRMVHTNTIAYGFLANAFLGVLHWVVPRLTQYPVLDNKLSWFIFAAWQGIVISAAVGIVLGHAQGGRFNEAPQRLEPFVLVALLLVAVNFTVPILRAGPFCIALWYFLAAFVWVPLAYLISNFLLEYAAKFDDAIPPGREWLFMHNWVGLFASLLGWGMLYYFVPIMLKKPIWSRGLSLIGLLGLAFLAPVFSPLTEIQHFLYSPIPMVLQCGAIISSVAVELAVIVIIVNFCATFWGQGPNVFPHISLRWYLTGMIFCLIASLQRILLAPLTFQPLFHFTDGEIAHAHLLMFGVFGFWIFGAMTYLFPQLLKREWYSQRLCECHYWFSMLSLVLMYLDLTLVSILQGFSWGTLEPWDSSIQLSIPYWWVRIFAGLGIIAGQVCFVLNLYKTYRLPAPVQNEDLELP